MAKIKQHIVMANVGGSKREEGGLASEEVGECCVEARRSKKEIMDKPSRPLPRFPTLPSNTFLIKITRTSEDVDGLCHMIIVL